MNKHIDNDNIHIGLEDDAISATETTGLMPSLPHNEYEIHSYKEIDNYMQKPIVKRTKYNNSQSK